MGQPAHPGLGAHDHRGVGTLQGPMDATEEWLEGTKQEVNASKSLAFTTEPGREAVVTIAGAAIPPTKEFRNLGVGDPASGETRDGTAAGAANGEGGGAPLTGAWGVGGQGTQG